MGTAGMGTGSDTRLYAPRSESMLGWSKDDDDYRHGLGDPATMEQLRDKKLKEKEETKTVSQLPHLQIENPKPELEAPPVPQMPMPEDEPVMDDDNENARGAEVSQMTGMPDVGNLSIGAATGTKPDAGGQLVNMSEPMDNAWSSLLKERLDKVHGKDTEPWKREQFDIQPGGANISTATSRRAKLHSRYLQPSKKHGLMHSPLSVHMSHLGVATKQPLKLFPEKYGQQMGTMARRKLMGNVPQPMSGHAMGPERTYNPKPPSMNTGEGLKITEPRVPNMASQSLVKSEEFDSVKKELDSVKKKMDYMHFAQIRQLLRRLKDSAESRDRRLKSAVSSGPGERGETGHREGAEGTTNPQGATENLNSEDDPKNWGAPSLLFSGSGASKGSGRVG